MRLEVAGPPRFRSVGSSRATLRDPGRFLGTLPVAVPSLLGSGRMTPSPPACRTVSGLDGFSGVRLPLAALRVSVGTPPGNCSIVTTGRRFDLFFLPATLGRGWRVRPYPLVRWFQVTAHVFVWSCISVLKGLAPFKPSAFSWRTIPKLFVTISDVHNVGLKPALRAVPTTSGHRLIRAELPGARFRWRPQKWLRTKTPIHRAKKEGRTRVRP